MPGRCCRLEMLRSCIRIAPAPPPTVIAGPPASALCDPVGFPPWFTLFTDVRLDERDAGTAAFLKQAVYGITTSTGADRVLSCPLEFTVVAA
jgi:hypothetical protein